LNILGFVGGIGTGEGAVVDDKEGMSLSVAGSATLSECCLVAGGSKAGLKITPASWFRFARFARLPNFAPFINLCSFLGFLGFVYGNMGGDSGTGEETAVNGTEGMTSTVVDSAK
jgi:hypothetical protein